MYYRKALSKADRARLKQAAKVASTSDCDQRHGAIITMGGAVQSVAVNRHRNHPLVVSSPWSDCSTHAEDAALKALDYYAPGGTIYIARVGKKGSALMSYPCDACLIKIKQAGIKRVVWTLENQAWC